MSRQTANAMMRSIERTPLALKIARLFPGVKAMLSIFLHRKRKVAQALEKAGDQPRLQARPSN